MEDISLQVDEESVLVEHQDTNGRVRTYISTRFPKQKPPHPALKIIKAILFILLLPLILVVLLLALLIVTLLVITCIAPVYGLVRSKTDKKFKPKNLQRLDVGGYKIGVVYSESIINGDEEAAKRPVIIYISGLGFPITPIAEFMEQELSKKNRIVFIDRGNYGNSDDVPAGHKWFRRNSENSTEEIHAVLNHPEFKCKEEKSFVFLGGSQGGLFTLHYYYKYPEQVKAMLLVDPSTQDFYSKAIPAVKAGLVMAPLVYNVGALLVPTGLLRMAVDIAGLPKDIQQAYSAMPADLQKTIMPQAVSWRGMRTSAKDFGAFSEGCEQVREVGKHVTKIDVPVIVMTGLDWSIYDQSYSKIWQAVQYDIVKKSTDGVQILLPNNSHAQTCLGEAPLMVQCLDELFAKLERGSGHEAYV